MSISAKVIADSKNEYGQRITTLEVVMPRYILAEFNTHRMFSRNSASSRAIPFKKMVKTVEETPFIPYAWQEDHKGMQGNQYLDDKPASYLNSNFYDGYKGKEILDGMWAESNTVERPEGTALYHMVEIATELNKMGVTKQLANRLLEPFMYHKVLVTSTEWENFFQLRCPQYKVEASGEVFRSKKDYLNSYLRGYGTSKADKEVLYSPLIEDTLGWLKINKGQADIHMMFTAEAIWDAINESTPKELRAGDWHIPYVDNIMDSEVYGKEYSGNNLKVKIATARCARVSYTVVGEEDKPIDYAKDIQLHDTLAKSGHWSPFEHCAKAMSNEDMDNYMRMEAGRSYVGWCRNFKGFIQYRSLIDNEI